MIKHYQWTDFEALKKKFDKEPDVLDLIDSLQSSQRKNKFYEYYHIDRDLWKKNKEKMEEALDKLDYKEHNTLIDLIGDVMDDYEQIQTERDMFESFYFERKLIK